MNVFSIVPIISSTRLSTKFGNFQASLHRSSHNSQSCLSFATGDLTQKNCLVRIHSSCLFAEAFHSFECDCKQQLNQTFELIQREGRGVIIYLDQEGRGHGLLRKINAMNLENELNLDTVEAFKKLHYAIDPRSYKAAIDALGDLKVSKQIKLVTNNPKKIKQVQQADYEVDRVELVYDLEEKAVDYLTVKKNKLGHLISDNFLKRLTNQSQTAVVPFTLGMMVKIKNNLRILNGIIAYLKSIV
ncbi:MAG: GTP cyclohydrolase II RibA [Candidatus Pacebacteria bacterium]|nr:GTP cyclohydrolase II RibA [Candidatus Paceibacterota bacterium]